MSPSHAASSSPPHTRPEQEMLNTFGKQVRSLRIARGWSGERLAQQSSLTIATVLTIERGGQEPLLSTVMLLMDALAVGPAELLADIRSPPKKRSWVPRNAR